MQLVLEAPVRVEVELEASADLVNWTGLGTLTFDRQTEFTDSEPGLNTQRFYRARLITP